MTRLAHAWRELDREQQLAAIAAIGLFVSMFLPWYSQTNTVVVDDAAKATRTSLSAFESFSFVEAAVLLVSAGVLCMLFARAEHHVFKLPGGDGMIVMIAGGWAALLIFYRMLEKPGLHGTQRITAAVGVQWGIFIALGAAGLLGYAGSRMRAGRRPEPPLTRSAAGRPPRGGAQESAPVPRAAGSPPLGGTGSPPLGGTGSPPLGDLAEGHPPSSERPRYPPPPPPSRKSARQPVAAAKAAEQLSFEDPPPEPGKPPA